jgi:hypothetical protein
MLALCQPDEKLDGFLPIDPTVVAFGKYRAQRATDSFQTLKKGIPSFIFEDSRFR